MTGREHEIATCTFCPKLCRFACPVAEAECRETVTPWGLMTRLDDVRRETEALDPETAELLGHCTGCGRCAQICKHSNDVPGTLFDARAEAFEAGVLPRPLVEWARFEPLPSPAFAALPSGGRVRLLPGFAPDSTVEAAIRLLRAVGVAPTRCATTHAGARFFDAGLRGELREHFDAMQADLSGAERVICIDPADVVSLRRSGIELPATHLSQELAELTGLRPAHDGDVLYLDSCRLGRGLGVYDEPRELLARVISGELREAFMHHAEGGCCGASAGYPTTSPEGARQAAIEAAEDEPELPVVTAGVGCADHLRASLAPRPVYAWAELVAAGLEER